MADDTLGNSIGVNAPPATALPRATSVAGPIASPPSVDLNDPANFYLTQAPVTAPSPSVDGSSIPQSAVQELHNLPSDEAFDQAVRLNEGDLRWPLTAFKNINPDVAAKVDQLAKANGLPFSTALAGKDDLGVLKQAQDIYASLSATDDKGNFIYPNTIKWLQDGNNLAKSKDDIDALKGIESLSNQRQQIGESGWFQTARSALAGIERGLSGVTSMPAAIVDLLRAPFYPDAHPAQTSADQQPIGGVDQPDFILRNPKVPAPEPSLPKSVQTGFGASTYLNDLADATEGQTLVGKNLVGELQKGNYIGAAQQAVAGLSSFLPTIAVAALNPEAGLIEGAGSSGGSQYQADLAAGKSPDQAGADAVLNADINAVGLKTGGAIGQLERMKALFAAPAASATTTALMGRVVRQAVVNATQGGATQAAIQSGDDLADYATGNKDAFKNEIQKVANAGLLGALADGVITTGAGLADAHLRIAAQQEGQTWKDKLSQVVQGSKLRERDPDALADNITQNQVAANKPTAFNTDANNITTFFQGRPDEMDKFATDMGTTSGDISNAAKTGGDIELPIGPYMAKYDKTPIDQVISKDIRFVPGGLSTEDLGPEIEKIKNMQKAISDQLTSNASVDSEPLSDRLKAIRTTLMTDKEEGGAGYSAQQADSHMAFLLAGLRHSVAAPGETVAQAADRLGLEVKVGDAASGNNVRYQNRIDANENKGQISGDESQHSSQPGDASAGQSLEERARGGDPEAAASLLRSTEKANSEPSSGGQSLLSSNKLLAANRKRALQDLDYKDLADRLGKLREDEGIPEGANLVGQGVEHQVHHADGDSRVTKLTKSGEHGISIIGREKSSPASYLERLALQNKIFGDDIKWEGISGDNKTITSQPVYVAAKDAEGNDVSATPQDIKTRMEQAGFVNTGHGEWYHPQDKVVASDAHPRNFIKQLSGRVEPIDLQLKHATPEEQKAFASDPKVKEGITRYQDARGAISFADGKTTIHIFKTADMSTFLHEASHLFLDQRQKLIDQGLASDQAKADQDTLYKYAGVKPGEKPNTEQVEKMAKSFEAYVMEGKSPSLDLADVFSRFRGWLTNIYRSVTALGVSPTGEVRQVFDRMLASEEDIHHANEYYSRTDELLGMIKADEAEKNKVRVKRANVQRTELEKQTTAYLKSYLKAIGGVSTIRDAAKAEVENQPIYKAIDDLKTGKINESELKDALGQKGFKEFTAKFPDTVRKESGEHSIESLAAKHGFDSPESLVDNLLAAVPKQEAIRNFTSRLVADKEERLRNEIIKNGATPADNVTHTDASLAYLIAETQLLAKQLSKGKPVRIEERAYKEAARQTVANMPVKRAVRYDFFAKTEARLARQVIDLAKAGKMDEALEARKRQLAQHAMVQESIRARDERAVIERRYSASKLKAKLEKVDNAYLDPIKTILSRYELSDEQPSASYDLKNISNLDRILFAQIPEWLIRGENAGDYRNMPWGRFKDVDNAAKGLISFGTDARKSDLAVEEKTIGTMVESSLKNINALPDRNVRQLGKNIVGNAYTVSLQKLNWLKSHITKAQFLFKILDNFSELKNGHMGIMSKLFHALSGAESKQSEAQHAVYDLAKPHLKVLAQATDRLRKENGRYFSIPGADKPDIYQETGRQNWSPEEAISYMLNTGAEGNRSALKNAFGHDQPQIDRVAAQFKPHELEAIEGLRDSIESLFNGLDATHFKLYNRNVEKVDAVPMHVTANDGTDVEMKGGYWPLVYDYEINRLQGKYSEQDVLDGQIKGFLRSSTPEDGFTKSRVTGHSLAPRLDMGVFADHVDDTTRFIHMAPILRDVDRVMQNSDWRNAVISKVGGNEYEQARDWLRGQADPGRKTTSSFMTGADKVADQARALATAGALGFNFVAGLKWRTSMINSAVALGGWRWIAEGYKGLGTKGLGTSTLGLSNTETWKMIESKSKLLGPREVKGIRDIHDDVEKLRWNQTEFKIPGTDKTFTTNDFKHAMYEWAKMNDRAVVAPVWMGAYQKYIRTMGEANMTEAARENAAIDYADSVIQTSQPSSLNVDMNSVQRNQNAFLKLFTMFMSYPYTIGNRFMYYAKALESGAINKKQYASHVMQEVLLEPLAREGIKYAALGTAIPAAAYALGPMSNIISGIPGLNTLFNVVQDKFDPSDASPTFDVFRKARNVYSDIVSGKDLAHVAWSVARFTAYVTKIPALNVVKTLLDFGAEAKGQKNTFK